MSNESIKFKYLFEDNYDPEYVNGIYGGINPCGELVLHFFLERIPLPFEETVSLDDSDGSFGETIAIRPEEYKFIRSIKNGVVMNKDTAQTLLEWLQSVIPNMEAGDVDE